MDPYSFVLNAVASEVAGQLIERVTLRELSNLAPEFKLIHSRLDSIEESLDRQDTMWLRSAMTFLKMGQLESARDDLVRATAVDERDATSRFLLGLTLAAVGHEDGAVQFLGESWQRNPLLFFEFGNFSFRQPSGGRALVEAAWQIDPFPRADLEDPIREQSGWLARKLKKKMVASYILEVAAGAGVLIVHSNLVLGPHLWTSSMDVLSAHDLANGEHLWSKVLTDDLRVILSTPKYIVLSGEGDQGPYRFLSTLDGSEKGEMRARRFESLLWPTVAARPSNKNYAATHRQFCRHSSLVDEARELKADASYQVDEKAVVTDYTGSGAWQVTARNLWTVGRETRKYKDGEERIFFFANNAPSLARDF
jgi:hypothetical protein